MSSPEPDDGLDALFREALVPLLTATPPRSAWRTLRRAVATAQTGDRPTLAARLAAIRHPAPRAPARYDALSWIRAAAPAYPPIADAPLRITSEGPYTPFAALMAQRFPDLRLAS